MDEAMHPLTLMAVGLYGKVLPNQNGAPLRLIVPWKYGFKGIKAIVSISIHGARAAYHLGRARRRTSTVFMPTSIRPSIIREGHGARQAKWVHRLECIQATRSSPLFPSMATPRK